MSSLKLLLAAASIAVFTAPAAFAQSAPPPDGAQQQHAWHKPSPEQMAAWHAERCKSRYARVAGKLAYLQADLSITDAQRGAFDQWKGVVLSSAKAHSDACLAHMADGKAMMHHHDALERNARMQKMLEGKLAELKAERPALESLYASLTPDQKQEFDRAAAFGHHHGHHMGHGMGGQRFGRDGGWQQRAPG
ncbi:MAG TPA: Spy/CpxP family protein refolding chaperone [Rhizomicrobium sp.]|nr:Spy/CpxP family protein refolding chaperone [Rhizomicrobium sp.]